MPHIHHANNKPSPIRKAPWGSTPWNMAVAKAKAIPPSTKIAWQVQGPVQGVSSLILSTLRPNRTHGQNKPSHKLSRSSAQPHMPVVQGSSAGGS
jgi:hypothetical protein